MSMYLACPSPTLSYSAPSSSLTAVKLPMCAVCTTRDEAHKPYIYSICVHVFIIQGSAMLRVFRLQVVAGILAVEITECTHHLPTDAINYKVA